MANYSKFSAFIPEVGKCYEVHFGKITLNGRQAYVSARIRVLGGSPADWQDMDTNQQLDTNIAKFVVQAHREIQCLP